MKLHTPAGISLGYEDAGHGNAVILLHAFPLSRAMWSAQVNALQSEYRVITPDLRGFGDTDRFTDAPSIETMADDVAALLDAINLREPIILGGLSMGGYVSLAFARKYPHRLRALILADTRAEADSPEARHNRSASIELVKNQGPAALVEQMLPKLLGERTTKEKPEVLAQVRSIAASQSRPSIIGGLEALRDRPDATAGLGKIRLPTLVLVGSEDSLTPPSVADALAARIAGARKVIISGAGHLANLEQPQLFNHALRSFLATPT